MLLLHKLRLYALIGRLFGAIEVCMVCLLQDRHHSCKMIGLTSQRPTTFGHQRRPECASLQIFSPESIAKALSTPQLIFGITVMDLAGLSDIALNEV